MTYKVLARPINSKNAYKTFKEFPTLDEALATAARLNRNAGNLVEIIVEMPNNSLRQAPLELVA